LNKYNCVLFDLDGTLMDTTPGVLASVHDMLDELKISSLSDETIRAFVGPPMKDSLMKHCGFNAADAQSGVVLFRKIYMERHLLNATVYDGIFELLDALLDKGVSMAVASNKGHAHVVKILEHCGIAKYCKCIKGANPENTMDKSDIVNYCMEKLGIKNLSQAVLVGDSEYDAIGASTSGIDFIGVTYGFGFRDTAEIQLLDHVGAVATVKELHKLLIKHL